MFGYVAEHTRRESNGVIDEGKLENAIDKLVIPNQANDHSNSGCMEHGICSHDVLRDMESESKSNVSHGKMMRKVCFT